MIKSCYVACYDDAIKNIIIQGIKSINSHLDIVNVDNEGDLIFKLNCGDEVTVFFDKYFLGYILKYKLKHYKVLNPKANIVFVEKGYCPIYFGLRLHCLGVNGFICNIEESKTLPGPLMKALEKIECYPEEVLDSIRNNEHILERKSCSEITEKELEIGLYMGQGKTLKEICSLMDNMAIGTAGSHMNRLRKKIGYKNVIDLMILNKRSMHDDLRRVQ